MMLTSTLEISGSVWGCDFVHGISYIKSYNGGVNETNMTECEKGAYLKAAVMGKSLLLEDLFDNDDDVIDSPLVICNVFLVLWNSYIMGESLSSSITRKKKDAHINI